MLTSAEWQFSTATTEPPTGSQIRFDDSDPALVSTVWVRNQTADGADVHAALMAVVPGDTFYLQDFDDSSRWCRFEVAADPIDKTDYVEFAVSPLDQGAALIAQRVVLLITSQSAPTTPGPLPTDLLVDPAWIAAAVPGTTPEQALTCAQLATLIVETVLWPASVPDPVPPPITMAAFSIGCRLAVAGAGGEQAAGERVISESLGAYSYRLANVATIDGAFALTDYERRLLGPWLTTGKAYELDTGGAIAMPWWWFQYDLDRPNDYPPGYAAAPPAYPAQLPAPPPEASPKAPA